LADVAKTDDLLSRVVANFDAWWDATITSREESMRARDYYDGYQWTAEEIAAMKARRQPPIVDNKIKDKIDYMVGLEVASRTDPKAYPRTPAHEQDAEAITDALRYIGDAQDFPKIRSDVAENMFIEGMGGAEVIAKRSGDGMDVVIRRNRWERCYWDPYSSEADFGAARVLGTFAWMDIDDARGKWKDHADLWDQATAQFSTGGMSESDDDRPSEVPHFDAKRRRVRVIEQYYRHQGTWLRCVFVKGGFLEEPKPSPYHDEDGEPEHPYAWVSAYVDKDNRRYGIVRRFESLQDEINHRRSKSLHLLNTRGVVLDDGAVSDVQKLRKELAKPDYVVEKTPGMELAINQNLDLSAGHAALLQQATEALSITGPKAPTNVSASQSGRAKQLDRQSDALEVGRLFDKLRHFQKVAYRKAWHRVKQFWTEEKWVRIRDDEGAPKFAVLNKGLTAAELMQVAQQNGMPVLPQLAEMAALTPTKVLAKRNDVAKLDVDIVLDDMPDVAVLQQEQFAELVTLAQAGVVFPPDVYLDASNLRNKKALKEKLTGGDSPELQAAAQVQQELQARGANAEVTSLEAEAAKAVEEAKQAAITTAVATAGAQGMAAG